MSLKEVGEQRRPHFWDDDFWARGLYVHVVVGVAVVAIVSHGVQLYCSCKLDARSSHVLFHSSTSCGDVDNQCEEDPPAASRK